MIRFSWTSFQSETNAQSESLDKAGLRREPWLRLCIRFDHDMGVIL